MTHFLQLAALAKYLGISIYAPEPILRYQLRSQLNTIKADDKDLAQEGTATLSRAELEQACEARGMRVSGLSDWILRRQLDDWLELSIEKEVPMTLLVLSRAYQIATSPGQIAPTAEQALQESISSIDKNVVQEVVLAQGGVHAADDAESKANVLS
jgi:LETM1 and EF-hand domain-containing protein 1